MTSEVIYGVGAAHTDAAALDVARSEAAKTLSVEVQEQMTDTQLVWVDRVGAAITEQSRDRIARAASSSVARRLDDCKGIDRCKDELDAIHVLVACARRSSLERQLIDAAHKIALAATGKVGPLLGVPGTDDSGYITQLGQYALNVVRDSLAAANGGGLQIVSTAPWRPVALHEAARVAGATHLIRVEYLALDETRVRFSVYLQDVATDRHVAGTDVGFEAQLDPSQFALLSVKGPLLPQKEAQDLINASGSFPVPLRLSKTELREGDVVGIAVTPPREGYLYVYDIYEDGRAVLLVPSPVSTDNHCAAHVTVEVPDASWQRAGLQLRACPLNGQKTTREYVKVILSPVQLDLPGTGVTGSAFTMLAPSVAGNSIAAIQRRLDELQRGGVPIGTAEMPYFIRAATRPAPECQSLER